MTVIDSTTAVAKDQSNSVPYTWTLESKELQGNLWLYWKTTGYFRAQRGKICVYKTQGWPLDPEKDRKEWSWDNENGGGSGWDTGLTYGADWYCAWTAE